MTRNNSPKKSAKALEKSIQKLNGWNSNAELTKITKVLEFSSFINALSFVAKIAVHAEVLNHHPTITITYKTVKVILTTHDAQGLTKLDFELAKRIDDLKNNC